MRQLLYDTPRKLIATNIHKSYFLNSPAKVYYERASTIYTIKGLVTVYEIDWQHNNGKTYTTIFETVIDGIIYSATLNEVRLKDNQIKWLSTNFIKNIKTIQL